MCINWNSMKIMHTGKRGAEENMRMDSALLASLQDEPILRFYDWVAPSITYGYFLDPALIFKKNSLDLARRPTGGGVLFHMWDLVFSLLIPSSHPLYTLDTVANYKAVHELIGEALKSALGKEVILFQKGEEGPPNFCFATPSQYDLMVEGKKIVGGAQRRRRNGFLHQGSVHLMRPDWQLVDDLLLEGTPIIEGMQKWAYEGGSRELIAFHLQKTLSAL